MEYVGPAFEWDEEIVRGSIDEAEFSLWYLDGDRLRGGAGGRTAPTISSARAS